MKRLLLTLIILLLSLPAQAQLIIVAKKKSGADTTPPAMSNPIPTGSQSCVTNPNSIILGITTDENATSSILFQTRLMHQWGILIQQRAL